jgi:hypothetical protein
VNTSQKQSSLKITDHLDFYPSDAAVACSAVEKLESYRHDIGKKESVRDESNWGEQAIEAVKLCKGRIIVLAHRVNYYLQTLL